MTERDLQLLAYLGQFLTDERKQQFEKVLDWRTNHFAIGLENIFQPHNANAAIRSCDCFGIQEAHVIESINKFAASRGVSKGAVKWVSINKYNTTTDALKAVKSKGYQVVATTPHHHDCTLYDFDISKKSIFFFGAEKKGLSEEVLSNADCRMYIPMVGHTESLNISVSVAITLAYLTNQLRNQNKIDWRMSEDEKNKVRLEWTKVSTNRLEKLMAYFDKNN